MKLPKVHIDRYMWDLRIQLYPTTVPVFGNGILKEISFDVNPLWEKIRETESRLHLEFTLENGSVTEAGDQDAIRRLREHMHPDFQPIGNRIRTNAASFRGGMTSGSFRVPLELPPCNFSKHAVTLLKQVVAGWEIDFGSPGLRVTRETLVKVRKSSISWVGFGQYLEMKAKGEL